LFRKTFLAELKACFVVPSTTFDNVKGEFPIGFKIWDTENKVLFTEKTIDIFNKVGKSIGTKKVFSYDGCKFINEWLIEKRVAHIAEGDKIGFLGCYGNDFLNQNICRIQRTREEFGTPRGNYITKQNITEVAVYYAVRKSIKATWLNDRDQFLSPNEGYETDNDFQTDCLVYTLFNNNIQAQYGVNHWIPFTETEIDAKERFASHFMSGFLKGKVFSGEAGAVLDAGCELWKYYHVAIKENRTAPVDAALYDIREFFQGRNDKGFMNTQSEDEAYTRLIKTLRENLRVLAESFRPKIYEYGFLKG
jgi:hypothetical protein